MPSEFRPAARFPRPRPARPTRRSLRIGAEALERRVMLAEGPTLVEADSRLPGDADGDGRVDLRDLAAIRSAIGSRDGQARFVPAADLDGDGRVTRLDFGAARRQLGRRFAEGVAARDVALRVPGAPGEAVHVAIVLEGRSADYRSEVGLFRVDAPDGRIGRVRPGDPGYARAALARRVVLFEPGDLAGTERAVTLPGGALFGTYIIPDGTAAEFLSRGPRGRPRATRLAYFSFPAANPDLYPHVRAFGPLGLGIEDQWSGGDRDHDDAVLRVIVPGRTPARPGPAPTPTSPGGPATGTPGPGPAAPEAPDDATPGPATPGPADATAPAITFDAPTPGILSRSNVAVEGQAVDDLAGLLSLEYRVGAGPFLPLAFDAEGRFRFDTALPLDGSADGTVVVVVRATDRAGNIREASRSFVLDATPPAVTLGLDPAWDSVPVGDGRTLFATISLVGLTEPGLSVELIGTGRSTRADASGRFRFDGLDLAEGPNAFVARAVDPAGNAGTGETVVQRLRAGDNLAPAFVSEPRLEALVGRPYAYDALALDPDADPVAYALVAGPEGLTVDPSTGRLAWAPAGVDRGNHSVIVRADDGRGGLTDQAFTLAAVDLPPNRPPTFLTDPVAVAAVGSSYRYDPAAADPDLDPLSFALVAGPEGLAADPSTGRLAWTPTAAQLGTHEVVLEVSDGRGGSARQAYRVAVGMSPGNRPPTIVSDPVVQISVPADTNPPLGLVGPARIDLDATGPAESRSLSLSLPVGAAVTMVDVFLALDNTGSWTSVITNLLAQFPAIINRLQEALPGVSLAFGVGRFDDFRAVAGGANTDRPFTLNQPIITTDTPGFAEAIDAALRRQRIGSGGDQPESLIEAIYQVATGAGFDGNGNGTTTDSGPAGLASTQTAPGTSGDVPAFATFTADPANHVLPPSGTLGGVGFRVGALPVILGATHVGTAYQPDGSTEVVGIGGVTVPLASMTVGGRGSTTGGRGASFQQAVDAMVDLGALFIGLGTVATPAQVPRNVMEGLAVLTGAVNRSGESIDGGLAGDPIDPGDPFFFTITATSAQRIADGVVAAVTSATTDTAFDVDVIASDPTVRLENLSGVARGLRPGETATFDVRIEAGPPGRAFDVVFVRSGTNLVLGSIPATVTAPHVDRVIAVDPDGDALTYTLVAGPEGLGLDPASGELRWLATPADAGLHPVTLRVDDGRGGSDVQSFVIEVVARGVGTGEIRGTFWEDLNANAIRDTNLVVGDEPTVLFVIDASGSMDTTFAGTPVGDVNGDGRVNTLFDAAAAAILALAEKLSADGMGETARIGIVLFGLAAAQVDMSPGVHGLQSTTTPLADLDGDGVLDTLQAVRTINTSFPGINTGFTNYEAGLRQALAFYETAQARPGQENVIFLSDGLNNRGGSPADEAAALIDRGVNLQAFGIGPDSSLAHLRLIDADTRILTSTDELLSVFNGLDAGSLEYVEPTLGGWTVYLDLNNNGRREAGEPVTLSDADGNYAFNGLAAGTYIVRAEGRPGLMQTFPGHAGSPVPTGDGSHTVVLASGQVAAGRDFGRHHLSGFDGNLPPRFSGDPPASVNLGSTLRAALEVLNPDNDPLTFDLPAGPAGMAVHPTLGVIIWTPSPDQLGDHTAVVRVRDDRGGIDLRSFRIEVLPPNAAPVIASTPTGRAAVDRPYAYAVRAFDADGDAIIYRLEVAPASMTIDAATGRIAWTPAADQVGTHRIVVAAGDARGAQSLQGFDLVVVAEAPNSVPEIASAPRDRTRPGLPYYYAVEATDPDGDPLTYRLIDGPAGMILDSTGLLTWLPGEVAVGKHPVTVEVDDGRGGVARQSWMLVVASLADNRPPAIVSDPTPAATLDRPYRYDARAVDPDGDVLDWSLAAAPRGMAVDLRTGRIAWTPAADQLGEHRVLLRVIDGRLAEAYQEFNVTARAVNLPPRIVSAPPTLAAADRPYLDAVQAVDPERNPLRFALQDAPGGMTIDAATGRVSWTPGFEQAGEHAVTVVVSDDAGGEATQAYRLVVSVGPINLPPEIVSTPPAVAIVGAAYAYEVEAVDPEGEAVRFELLSGPAGMTIDATTGRIAWTPSVEQAGSAEVVVAAFDPRGAGGRQRFLLRVAANRPPQVVATPATSTTAGLPYVSRLVAFDPDGHRLTYRMEVAPPGLTIDGDGFVRWTPGIPQVGPQALVAVVRDEAGAEARAAWTLDVLTDLEAPVVELALPGGGLVDLGSGLALQVRAVDNVAVASLAVTIGGRPVALSEPDDSGIRTALVPMDLAGVFVLEAVALDPSGNRGTASREVRVFDLSDSEAPSVEVISPALNSEVTYLVDVVGTVRDDNLEFWRVEYARADLVNLNAFATENAAFIEIARGTGNVEAGVLARFDPTLLANDSYVIRLYARDTNGRINTHGTIVHVSGEAKLGNFRLDFVDLSVPLAGVPIRVVRTYDTLQAATPGDFGFGWSLSVGDAQIRETVAPGASFRVGTRVFLTNPEGRRVGFTFEPTVQATWFGPLLRPRFVPDPGVTDRLEVADAGLSLFPGGVYGGFVLGGIYNPDVYTLTTREGVRYEYHQRQGLRRATDPNGNHIVVDRDGAMHSSGLSVGFRRDERGRIAEIVDPSGYGLQYSYDDAGDLVAFADQMGATTTYAYRSAPAHFLDTITDPLGFQILKSEFDTSGRLVGITDALGANLRQDFDPGSFRGTITDANNNVTELIYDARGNIVERKDPEGGVTRYEYADPANPGKETRVVDPNGHATSYTYDARGNTTSVTDPLGNVRRTTYDAAGRVATEVDALGRVTTFRYDSRGGQIQVIDATGASRVSTRDDQGRMTSLRDETGLTATFFYDQGCGCGSPRRIVNPDGGERLFEHNASGRITRIVDERGFETSYEYDAAGRIVAVVDGNGNRVGFGYNAAGYRTSMTDPLGNTTRYVYDPAGRVVEEIDPLGQSTRSRYDPTGNLVETVDRNGRVVRYAYDRANRLLEETWLDPAGTPVRRIVTTYDAAGNRLGTTDPDATLTFTYDALGRVATAGTSAPAGDSGLLLTYRYDATGSVIEVADNLGARVGSTYDARGRLTGRSWEGDGLDPVRIDFGYDLAGRMTEIGRRVGSSTVTPGVRTAIGRDANARVASIAHHDVHDEALASYVYDYDRGGLIRGSRGDAGTVNYEYDAIGQLVRATHDDPSRVDESYRYDAAGNRVESHLHGSGYHVGSGNRLLSDGTFRYDYDAEGNLVRRLDLATGSATLYEYDHRNRLTRVLSINPDGGVAGEESYTYDADNRRIARRDADGTTTFTYDGKNAWADFDASGAIASRFFLGSGLDSLLGWRDAEGATRFTLADRLGTVGTIVDASGEVIAASRYDSFGRLLGPLPDLDGADRFSFTGRELDSGTGLYHYRARSYDATIGRFTSQDPIGFRGLDYNLYRYVSNNPVNGTDPEGTIAYGVILFGALAGLFGLITLDSILDAQDARTIEDCKAILNLASDAAGTAAGAAGVPGPPTVQTSFFIQIGCYISVAFYAGGEGIGNKPKP